MSGIPTLAGWTLLISTSRQCDGQDGQSEQNGKHDSNHTQFGAVVGLIAFLAAILVFIPASAAARIVAMQFFSHSMTRLVIGMVRDMMIPLLSQIYSSGTQNPVVNMGVSIDFLPR
ncbi:MAG: hypothetical protein WEA36_07230 [Balneolaceae bacterium]